MRKPCLVLFLIGTIMATAAHGADAPAAPKNLRCEYSANPLGLDVLKPRLSWEVNDTRRNAKQSAYQILVGATEQEVKLGKGALWDSGKVASPQSIHVVYAGPALKPRQRCYWTVRTWDAADVPSPYAPPGFWEMGLLQPGDWQAKWITIEESVNRPQPIFGDWIWNPEENGEVKQAYFRKTVELPFKAKVKSAIVWATADNEFRLYINGKEIGGGEEWKAIENFDVAAKLKPGKNIFAVEGKNRTGIAGLVLGSDILLEGGKTIEVRTNDEWRTSTKAPEKWKTLEFSPQSWVKPKVVCKYGDQPWGAIGKCYASPSFYLRKTFDSARPDVLQARLYISALGAYRCFINGKRIGADELTPGWTCYPKHIMYQTYDATAMIKEGKNAIGLVLGNGWWGQGMAGAWKDGNLRAIAQLEITFRNGETQVLATDESWKGHFSPILEDSIYNGETYDATKEIPGWNQHLCDDAKWLPAQLWKQPLGELVAQTGPPIRITEDLQPVAVTQPKKGVFVFDFGQNAAGRPRLKVNGPKGTRVQIRHAEILLPDGTLYTDNYRGAKSTDVYILKGEGDEIWEPMFTYRGFRYAELTGFPGTPEKDALVMRVMHAATPVIGDFACSDDLINRIQKNILWGMRSNFYSVPTDCPQRDERLGWTGDAQLFMATGCLNMDLAGYLTKWMRDLTDCQTPEGGVTDVAPTFSAGPGAPAWADVITVIPWDVYTYYGDTRIIESNYKAMAAWVDYMRNNATDGLWDREGYGDWVPVEASPKKPIAGAYQFYSTSLLGKMAQAIGKPADMLTCAKEAVAIADLFGKRYFNPEKNCYEGNTQTANLVPLWFGLTPEDRRAAVLENLVKDIVKREYHLSTGFIGTAYLLPVLSTFGKDDVAWKLATQTSYPSWGHMVEAGGTTIWERWNSDRYKEVGADMNSFNHFAFGTVGQWYYEYLAGIRPAEPGFKRILIAPHVTGPKWVKASYASMYGPIRCEWHNDGAFSMEVEIPANTTAAVLTPVPCTIDLKPNEGKIIQTAAGATQFELGAGVYHLKAAK